MAVDVDKLRTFLRDNFVTAIVVGAVCVPSVWVAADKVIGARVEALKERVANLEPLKARVKELETEVQALKEINKRRDEVVPARVDFDPKDLYTPSTRISQGSKP